MPVCFTVDAESCQQCNLGMENNAIKDEQITSSNSNDLPQYGRLNLDLRSADRKSCWSASEEQDPWLQVDLKSRYYITAVLTQGCGDDNIHEWVKKYKISYRHITNQTVEYKVNGSVKVTISWVFFFLGGGGGDGLLEWQVTMSCHLNIQSLPSIEPV